jgi:BASS family bile acid:Na+ symporter
MSVIVVLVTVFAYFVDNSFTSWVGDAGFLHGQINVTNLLIVVMCGMGMTMKFSDFRILVLHPRNVVLGEMAQFVIMPLAGFLLSLAFALPPELAVGVILVGCCPGGTASNVITYMARGNVAFSVGMTSVSTLLAPVLTPVLTAFYVGLYTRSQSLGGIEVDSVKMFTDIIKIVIIPVFAGCLFNYFFSRISSRVVNFLPYISCAAICIIIGVVIDANSGRLFEHGVVIILVVMLHNLIGYLFGFLAGVMVRMSVPERKALAIEVGMQNSGMATTLASTCFQSLALATVPGAVFSAWHNISGAVAASVMARYSEGKPAGKDDNA